MNLESVFQRNRLRGIKPYCDFIRDGETYFLNKGGRTLTIHMKHKVAVVNGGRQHPIASSDVDTLKRLAMVVREFGDK